MRRESFKKAFIACGFFLVAGVSAMAQGPAREISGYVKTQHGTLNVQGVVVTLESEMGESIAQVTPEGNGSFHFDNLGKQIYYITVRAPGYQSARGRADLVTLRRASVFLTLVPERSPDATTAEPAAGTVGVNELTLPDEVRKELEEGRKLLFEDGEAKRSIDHFKRAIRAYANLPQAHLLLGIAYMNLKDGKNATQALEKAISLDETLAGAHLALGVALNEQGRFSEAITPLTRGLELDPRSTQGHYELGRAFWALDRWQEAEAAARRALELHKEFAPAHLLMGNVLLRKRDANGALAEFKEYLRLDPNGFFAPATREVIGKIEKALAGQK